MLERYEGPKSLRALKVRSRVLIQIHLSNGDAMKLDENTCDVVSRLGVGVDSVPFGAN